MQKAIRSPFFYVGDKYKIIHQIKAFMPEKINRYYEPFVGGGSSFLNIKANHYYLNDINDKVIELHKYLISNSCKDFKIIEKIIQKIKEYNLSCSFIGDNVPVELRQEFKKTYYSKYNKEAYTFLKNMYNQNKCKDSLVLYILLIYGFNHMIRFNKNGVFNLPVGNVDFNKNVFEALKNYIQFSLQNDINFENKDYLDFMETKILTNDDFVYLDPPYLISSSEYNKLWNEDKEKELYDFLDELNNKNIKFGVSNLLTHKGRENIILKNWMKKYKVYEIKSNYISRFDNSIKNDSKEVYITNYEKGN
ncbi:MAG: DNA adenine methylase [Cetobacterium sp.]